MLDCSRRKQESHHYHHPHATLTITSLLVISLLLLLTRNYDVVNAVTIHSNDIGIDVRNTRSSNISLSHPVSVLSTPSLTAKVNPVLKSLGFGTTRTRSTISLKAQQLGQAGETDPVVGYAAEWEYIGSGLAELDSPLEPQLSPPASGQSSTNPSPSRRLGPGSWLDSNGNWWIFGGQGPTTNQTAPINYLSDLWVYAPTPSLDDDHQPNSAWRLVYRPEYDGDGPLSVHPEDVVHPLMCGRESSGHLALFKGQRNWVTAPAPPATFSSETNSLFNEDGVVWVSEIPKGLNVNQMGKRKLGGRGLGGGSTNGCNWQKSGPDGVGKKSCNETQGLQWTSYICCDACLPEPDVGNSTFDFCPQFSQKVEPILWCSQESLMAFQLNLRSRSSIKSKSKPKREISALARGEETTRTLPLFPTTSTSTDTPTTFISQAQIPKVSQQRNFSVGEKPEFHSDAKKGKAIFDPSHISLTTNATTSNTRTRTGSGLDLDGMKNGSNSLGVGQPEKLQGGIQNEQEVHNNRESNIGMSTTTTTTRIEEGKQSLLEQDARNHKDGLTQVFPTSRASNTVASITSTTTPSPSGNNKVLEAEKENLLLVNWWKFDLKIKEWVKMEMVEMVHGEQIQKGNCRSVSDQTFLYILCPTKTSTLDRSLLLFDPTKGSVHSLGTIHLNNAFLDKKVWGRGRSVLHAVRSDNNQTVIFLAYHKLLDLWIHDHSSNLVTPVENVWRGASLHAFQHTASFYKLSLVISPPPSFKGVDKVSVKPAEISSDGAKKKQIFFYMNNPRSKLYSFEDPYPDAYYQITIVTDRSVFLPSRDAPALINAFDYSHKSQSKNDTIAVAVSHSSSQESIAEKNSTFVAIAKDFKVGDELQEPEISHQTEEEKRKDLKPDQRIHSQISITNPNPKPFIGESLLHQNQVGGEDRESHKQKDKIQSDLTQQEGRTKDGGLPKSELDLNSSFLNKKDSVVESTDRNPDQVHHAQGEKTKTTAVKAEESVGKEKYDETSQSKSNTALGFKLFGKSHNKTNNSPPVKVGNVSGGGDSKLGDVQVISRNQNYRILGIKRVTTTTESSSRVVAFSSHPVPQPMINSNRMGTGNIAGFSARPRFPSTGKDTDDRSRGLNSANEMRSPAGRGSLPVNNESNGKPQPERITTTTFGESQNSTNSNLYPGDVEEPQVLPVVRAGSELGKSMISENPSNHDHPSTFSPASPTITQNTTTLTRSKIGEDNIFKNVFNLSKASSLPSSSSPKAIELKEAVGSATSRIKSEENSSSLPGNLMESKQKLNNSSWGWIILSKRLNSSSASPSSTTTTEENQNHNHDQKHDLQNNYVSSWRKGREWRKPSRVEHGEESEKGLMSNETFMGDMAMTGGDRTGSRPLTYGSSETLIESGSDHEMQSINESELSSYSTFGSLIFFSLSLSIFASFGLFLFVRRCVKCPPRSDSVLIKEPPPIRYSVDIPDELSFHPHTPLV